MGKVVSLKQDEGWNRGKGYGGVFDVWSGGWVLGQFLGFWFGVLGSVVVLVIKQRIWEEGSLGEKEVCVGFVGFVEELFNWYEQGRFIGVVWVC